MPRFLLVWRSNHSFFGKYNKHFFLATFFFAFFFTAGVGGTGRGGVGDGDGVGDGALHGASATARAARRRNRQRKHDWCLASSGPLRSMGDSFNPRIFQCSAFFLAGTAAHY